MNPVTEDARETDPSGRVKAETRLDPEGVDVGAEDPFSPGEAGDLGGSGAGLSQSQLDAAVGDLIQAGAGRNARWTACRSAASSSRTLRSARPRSSTSRWTLRLTYANTGEQTILLDRRSSAIFRSMVSRSLKAAAAKRYTETTRFSYFDLRKVGFREGEFPREDAFVTLKPGELYSLEKEGFGVRLYDGTKDSEDELRPGHYFLQLRVATRYYLIQPEEYRERWRDKGYLWSKNVISEPMPFTVEKKPAVSKP